MSDAERLRRIHLWEEFKDMVPTIVREFSYEEIDNLIRTERDLWIQEMEGVRMLANQNYMRRTENGQT
jgi:hypothetical protein